MPSTSVQLNPGINLDTLETLMDQGTAENKRTVKNRLATQQHKTIGLIDERIRYLEEQKKNQWRSALFSFFAGLFAQGLQALDALVPTLGTGLSKVMGLLEKLNPFAKKSQAAQIDAEKHQGQIQQEQAQIERTQDYLQRLEQHETQMKERMTKAQENLAQAQEAAVRI
jgi:hypothetical protein